MLSLGTIASKIFGSANDRKVKVYRPNVAAIAALEDEVKALSDDDLRARTAHFKQQLDEGASIDGILVEAFATCSRKRAVRARNSSSESLAISGSRALMRGIRALKDLSRRSLAEPKNLRASAPIMPIPAFSRYLAVTCVAAVTWSTKLPINSP